MRILEVNTEKGWRGGERQTVYNIQGFKEAGLSVDLMCLHDCPLAQKSKSLHIPVHEVKSQLRSVFFLMRAGKNYDIIHVQTAKAQFHAVLAKLFHRRPIVYTRRVDFVPKGILTKIKYRLTNQLIAISTPIKTILNNFGIKNVRVITEIVEPKNPNKQRVEAFVSERGLNGKKIIATTSALVNHKDPITMVKAIHELSKTRTDFVFLHFGTGVLKEAVENQIKELDCSAHYKMLGFVENVEDFFSVFDVFVMSSEEEGLGSSVLDAFIYKVPVVSTNAGGLPEIIADHGLICAIKDYKALAKNIDQILNDMELKNRLTEKAYNVTIEKNSQQKITAEYIGVFNEVIKRS